MNRRQRAEVAAAAWSVQFLKAAAYALWIAVRREAEQVVSGSQAIPKNREHAKQWNKIDRSAIPDWRAAHDAPVRYTPEPSRYELFLKGMPTFLSSQISRGV